MVFEPLDDNSWFSMYEACRVNPIRLEGGVMSSRPVAQPSEPAITVVVIVDEFANQPETLASLANIVYENYSVILVCPSERLYKKFAGQLGAYSHLIKVGGVFQPKINMSGDALIVSGLQHSSTPYTCVLFGGDIIHPQALARAAAAINKTRRAYYYSLAFAANGNGWAHPAPTDRPDTKLAVFSTKAALHAASLRPSCECPKEFVWELAKTLQPSSELLPEALQFHIQADVDGAIDKRYLVFVEEAKEWALRKP